VSDDRDVIRLFVTGEIDYARQCVADWDELEALTEAGLDIGGHWGDDSDRYGELCGCVAAQRAFPPRPWWRDPGSILGDED
jgi:hypothetical protein